MMRCRPKRLVEASTATRRQITGSISSNSIRKMAISGTLMAPTWQSGSSVSRGGARRDKPNALPPAATCLAARHHIVTIDETLLAELGLPSSAPLGLFEMIDQHGRRFHPVERDPSRSFADITCTGEPLYATSAK